MGIFIKDIIPDSVAFRDGRLKVGDQIVAVSGRTLALDSVALALLEGVLVPLIATTPLLSPSFRNTQHDLCWCASEYACSPQLS